MSKNDDRILELRKQIEKKKDDIASRKVKFSPETNCVLDFDGERYNLNVVSDDTLTLLIIRLNMYNMSADNLKMQYPIISGYSTDLWIQDIKSKLAVSGMKKEENDLKKMEAKLTKLLSDDKKTELEIDEIAELLK